MTNLSPLAQTSIERDQWREKALAAEARIAELERERDAEAERIGDRVEAALLIMLRDAGLCEDLDASGCDSSDPADYIASQATMALVRAVDARDEALEKATALEAQAGALAAEGRRLIGAVEACAVAERGGPPVNWEAVDASQNAMREAVRAYTEG